MELEEMPTRHLLQSLMGLDRAERHEALRIIAERGDRPTVTVGRPTQADTAAFTPTPEGAP